MPSIFESLPWYIQDTLISQEYEDFLVNVQMEFGLTDEQKKALDRQVLMPLFITKGETAKDLVVTLQSLFKLDEQAAKKCAQLVSANTLLVFPQYFGDRSEFHTSLGGNPEQDLFESFTYKFITESFFNGFLEYLQGALDFDPEQEAHDMNSFFERELVNFLYVSDDSSVIRKLNVTLILLLGSIQNISEQLVHALSQNTQWLGAEKILLDTKEVEPTAAHWIKSFLGESNGEVSTISIPKYLSTSVNTKNLSDMDRGALVKLLETFRVLHTFPRSFENLDPEQWMVIPYRQEEKPITHTVGQFASLPVDQSINIKDESGIRNQESGNANTELGIRSQKLGEKNTKQSLQTNDQSMILDNDILTQADVIIKETGVNALNWERFRKLLASYLKGLRNDLDTKDRLSAPEGEGGIGLSQEDTDKVMKKAKEIKSQLASLPVSQFPPKADPPLAEKISETGEKIQITNSNTSDSFGRSRIQQPVVSSQQSVDSIKEESGIRNQESGEKKTKQSLPTNPSVPVNLPVVQPPMPLLVIEDVDGLPTLVQKTVGKLAPPKAVVDSTKEKSEIRNPKSETKIENHNDQNSKQSLQTTNYKLPTQDQPLSPKLQDTKPSHAARFSIPLKVNIGIPQSSSQKDTQSIAGVKRPQVLDAVEELRAMTLQDFRRLSQDPKEAIQKVYQKIILLEKESFTKKTAALESWRDNEVNKLYLQMGRESFGKGVSMQEVIEQRKSAGQDFLVEPEFDALLELNGLLRS